MSNAGAIVAVIAGSIYGAAWWLLIDAFWVSDNGHNLLSWYHWAPLLVSVLGTAVIFVCPRRAITGASSAASMFLEDDSRLKIKRISFFIAVAICLSALGTSALLAITAYNRNLPAYNSGAGLTVNGNYPLIALVLSSTLACFGTFLFKFGRPFDKSDDAY